MNWIGIAALAVLTAFAVLTAGLAAVLNQDDEPLFCGIDFIAPDADDEDSSGEDTEDEEETLVVISDSLTLRPIQVENARLIIGIGQTLGQPVDSIRAALDRSLSSSEFLNTAPGGLMGFDPALVVTIDVLDKGEAINHLYESVLSDSPPPPDEGAQWYSEVDTILTTWLLSANPTACEPGGGSLGSGGVVTADDVVVVQGITIHRSIAPALNSLLNAARRDGIVLSGWGWRSHQRQHELRKINGCPNDGSWVHRDGEDPSRWRPSSSCRTPTARPGFSNHESGLAVDFTYRGSTIRSRSSAAFRWLNRNAGRYGLRNLPSEPWHWSVDGR